MPQRESVNRDGMDRHVGGGGEYSIKEALTMRQARGFITFVLILFAGSLQAQESELTNVDMERGRAILQEAWDDTIRSELQMTEAEAAKFWPVYSAYRGKNIKIMDRYTTMIAQYVRRYDDADLSDEYADELIDSYFKIKRELLDVQEKYLPKFRRVLPPMKVARFFQLEIKMNAEIDAQLALAVPLVDPS